VLSEMVLHADLADAFLDCLDYELNLLVQMVSAWVDDV
jgi:hypothetical protein